ncbi:MAG TPA: hypothetical protein DDX92_13730 [Flavobacteriales bacterium]|jgi:type IX secretion system PorP/SprF family membrane protein|nr:hypothetical protein [Flavobacteriales bacterium]
MRLKRIFHYLFLSFVLLLFHSQSWAQDPQFSQFYANPLYLNPAFAGSTFCPRIAVNYRNQWPSLDGQFVTYSGSYDQYFDVLRGGVGALVYQDNAGDGTIKTFSASLMYAYTLRITENMALKAGFQGSFWQKSLDWNKLTFGDMIDPRYGFIYSTQETEGSRAVNNVDFSTGFLLYNEFWYLGVAVHHLAEPRESFFQNDDAVLYRKYTGHFGAVIPFRRDDPEYGSVSPNILFMTQGQASQLNLGIYAKKSVIIGGIWYRFNNLTNTEFGITSDAVSLLIGIEVDKFKFGYSYDITVSRLGSIDGNTGGAHEVSLGLKLNCPTKRRRFKALNCPEF